MSSKRNDILAAIKTRLLTLTNLHDERVFLGMLPAERVGDQPVVAIIPQRETPHREDGTDTRRILVIEVGVVVRVDPVKADAAEGKLAQANELYDAIHAKLESLVLDNANSNATSMNETGEVAWDSLEDQAGPLAFIVSEWTITYQRALGTTGGA